MRVIIKEPGQYGRLVDIPDTLEALQKAVGGYIEVVSIATDLVAVVDEEARLKGKKRNTLGLFGTIVFCGAGDGEFTSIPKHLNPEALLDIFA